MKRIVLTTVIGAIVLSVAAAFVVALFSTRRAADVAFGEDLSPRVMTDDGFPIRIREFADELRKRGVLVRGYLLSGSPGPYSVKEAVFQFKEVDGVFDTVRRELELVEDTQGRAEAWRSLLCSSYPTEWCPDADAECFVSKRLLDGADGDLYVVIRNQDAKKIFVIYQFLF